MSRNDYNFTEFLGRIFLHFSFNLFFISTLSIKIYFNLKNKVDTMGFYSENTIEQKRVTKLTGDINISAWIA